MYGSNQYGMNAYGTPTQYAIGMNWVNSVAEAERLELPPGGTAVFFDKATDGLMYIRTRDSYNIYNTRTFNISEIKPKEPESPYVTRTELEEMFNKFLGGNSNDTLRTNDAEQTSTTGESKRSGER